jgi:hypothetical protein
MPPQNLHTDNISSLEVEYSEIHNFLRYLLGYRAKIFNFSIVFNAAMLALVLAHIPKDDMTSRIILSVLGIGTTLIFLLAENRTISVFYQYIEYAKAVEQKLGIGVLSAVRDKLEHSKLSLRECFKAVYLLQIGLWIIVGIRIIHSGK